MNKEKIGEYFIEYYLQCGRVYEWRKERSPYRVYLSEMLLQRTRADQVVPAFKLLIDNYNSVNDLVKDFKNVIILTSSLGRKCRLDHFEKGLKYLLCNYEGNIPSEYDKLLAVPGIGPYIAAAIRLFGLGIKDTIIDTNVVRVISRLYGLEYTAETRRGKDFSSLARSLVPEPGFIEYSYGIIDFAAQICKSGKPFCNNCGMSSICKWYYAFK